MSRRPVDEVVSHASLTAVDLGLEELPGLIVPFKRETYKAVIAAFKNLA